jgi:hypothetical protein
MTAFSKMLIARKSEPAPPAPSETCASHPPRFGSEQPATPDILITRLRQNLDLGIPAPCRSNRPTPAKSRAHRRGTESPNFSFPDFWRRESETPRTSRVISEPSPSRYPRESNSFPTFRDRSLAVRDRIGFGSSSSGTNSLYVLGFYNVSGNINSKIRVI